MHSALAKQGAIQLKRCQRRGAGRQSKEKNDNLSATNTKSSVLIVENGTRLQQLWIGYRNASVAAIGQRTSLSLDWFFGGRSVNSG